MTMSSRGKPTSTAKMRSAGRREERSNKNNAFDVIEQEKEKDPIQTNETSKLDILDGIRLDGNLRAELESTTKDELVKKCLDLDSALN